MEILRSAKNRAYFFVTVGVVVLALIVFLYWLLFARFYVTTTDAYVHGNQIRLTPQISGIVSTIHTDETVLVEQGQLLVELDTTDQKLALEKSVDLLALAVRDVSQMFANVYQVGSDLEAARAEMMKLQIYYIDRESIKDSGAISVEEFVSAELAFAAMKAKVESLEFAIIKAITAVHGTTIKTHPLVKRAMDEVRSNWVALQRCKIKAPQKGIVAQRMVQVGESVSPDMPLLAIIPLDQIWVEANYKEVQLAKVRLGQSVSMKSDIYGRDCVYRGEVMGISAGTGAAFSVLPPQNATGNWIKIVQRVPVRVKLHPEDLALYPLRIGLSMKTKIDIRDQNGVRVPDAADTECLYDTYVFADQENGVEELIEQIVAANG